MHARGGFAPRRPVIAPMLLAGMASLLVAMWAGLVRMGWRWPVAVESWPAMHGVLMVGGFLGTVIGLERAVGLRRRWALAAPALTALGTLAVMAGQPATVGAAAIFLGSAVLAAVFGAVVRLQPALHTSIMTAGVVSWIAGNALWLAGWPIYRCAPWWIGFLTLTIAGERLELSRVLGPPRAARLALAGAAGLVGVGMAVSAADLVAGERVFGVGLLAVALWLGRFDLAVRTVRHHGQTRYIAACLVSGYVWLAAGGILFIVYGGSMAGPYYDAALHAVLVGFVFAMIFGHALIIFPALLGLRLPYRPAFYVPLAVLHLSLGLRVGGDLWAAAGVRQWGGLLNAAAIVAFLALLVRSAILGRRAPRP